MGPAALVFDVDGTLAETDDVRRAAFNLTFQDMGLRWRWSRRVYGDLRAHVSSAEKIERFMQHHNLDHGPKLDIKGLARRQTLHYHRLLESGAVQLRPGVARLIRETQASTTKLAVAGLANRQEFECLIINHLGISGLESFDAVITREDLPDDAHAREAYSKALNLLGISGKDAIAIDDSEEGIQAAHSLGMQTIATPSIYTSHAAFHDADLAISDLGHPAAPFQVLKGTPGHHNFASLDAIRDWGQQRAQIAA